MASSGATDTILQGLQEVARTPLAEAFTVPPAIYSSADVHRLERQRIFAVDWQCPGLAADIPAPGDYITFAINDQPFFSIRGNDGLIRSFSNVCLHRMMTLLRDRGNCRRIVCPYHAWTYDIEGRVIGAGHMGHRDPDFDKKGYRLPELRTELWHGWIYVTLSPDTPPVQSLLQELEPEIARYGLADYRSVARQDHVWRTNWKLLTENFMEGYHLPVAHRETVGAWMPIDSVVFPDKVHAAFTWQTFAKDENAKYGRAHPSNTRLEGKWRHTTVMPTVFPCHMYVLAPDHMWYLSLRPKGIDEVHVRFGLALAPEVYTALGDGRDKWLEELISFFDKVNAEDKFVVEGIAEGSRSPLAKSGPLSWLERELHDFARYLDLRLNGASSQSLREAAE
ncbi:MAG: Rieske 2Fe-2S domain-containing protein [Pseudomonadota bacterium]|nr:Rieske 2Fe-2S domain-containing protein [Pseudomonadota bacterium]